MDNPQQTQQRTGRVMIYLAWVVALGLLALFFDDILDRRENPNRGLTAYSANGPREVVLQRNRWGQYVAPGAINGEPVRSLLDTGATEVSIPAGVEQRLGLSRGREGYAETANGTVTVYDTRLDRVALGNIALNNVSAHINPHLQGDIVLLGMSFMKHLELVQKDGVLTLRQ